jgi:bifunctional enzyme CysN/CysC
VSRTELERMDVVVVGHVDHGKSTVIGRLMADTGSLPQGKLEQVKAMCAKNARPFEYAFLLDALKNEQAQGITIDTARCFFKTVNRHYIIHDAPGHIEFLKNMITGASRAQAALLVIDAHEGVRENSKRHGYILSMLGIRQIAVLVNKMDLLGWDRDRYQAVVDEYAEFLGRLGVTPTTFIPISARDGSNIVSAASDEAPWYDGPTVLEQVEAFEHIDDDAERPLRMPLQDVYRFTAQGDDRRIFAGTIETGRVRPGDEVVFLPSGKRSTVAGIEVLEGERPSEVSAGQAVGITLDTQVYARPGELMVRADELAPTVSSGFRANVFWMGMAPLVSGRRYTLRVGTAKVPVELERVLSVLDASELSSISGKPQVDRHDVAEVALRTTRPVAFDVASALERTARFVIVDGYEIAGCGMALEPLADDCSATIARGLTGGLVSTEERERRYGHGGKAVVFVGSAIGDFAEQVERRMFDLGVHSYYLGVDGVSGSKTADVLERDTRLSHLGDVAKAMADAGVVVVTALDDADRFDLERLSALAAPHELFVVASGESSGDVGADVLLGDGPLSEEAVRHVLSSLGAVGVLPDYEI